MPLTDAIIESIADPVVVIEPDYRVSLANASAKLAAGPRAGRLHCYERLHARDTPCEGEAHPCPLRAVIETGEAVSVEHLHTGPGGEPRVISIHAAPVLGEGGEVLAVVESSRDITESRRIDEERERLIADLRQALAQVKTLRGLLPICAGCKSVRNDQGYWEKVERYVSARTDATFSHGLCPDCIRSQYPDLAEDILADS